MTDFKDLNPDQLDAVKHVDGPLLILAGAGSGKTRVITYRIVNLVENLGVNPREILAVTFTNKASREMQERVEKLLGTRAYSLNMGTFHKICVRILRQHIDRLGYRTTFTIYDDGDQIALVKQVAKELELPSDRFSPRALLSHIGRFKSQMLEPHQVDADDYNLFQQAARRCYEIYQRKLKESNALDFDDLLNMTVRLLKEDGEIRNMYNQFWRYILVDEYQDTNKAQYELLRLLTVRQQNICVVGDDDQSIYRWRGADVKNILTFEEDYPNCKVVKLEQNYRSTQTILDAAHNVISCNTVRKEKKLWTEAEMGEKIVLFAAETERREAQYVAEEIKLARSSDNLKYSDIGVFYRTNAQSRAIEEQMRLAAIPYTIVGGVRFYERKEIKDIMAYMRVLVNEDDDVSVRRIINLPTRGIGARTIANINEHSANHTISFWQSLNEIGRQGVQTSAAVRTKLGRFLDIIEELKKEKEKLPVFDLYHVVLDKSGYRKMLEDEKTEEAKDRLDNLAELANEMFEFQKEYDNEATLERFLEEITLQSDIDQWVDEDDSVTMMTVHAAKGLEFPLVFLTGMEEQLFPHSRSLDLEEDLEEERRLAYVGITRAMRKLYFTMARTRMINGISRSCQQSRFLSDIDGDLIDNRALPAWDELDIAPSKWNTPKPQQYGKIGSFQQKVQDLYEDQSVGSDSEPVYDADAGEILSPYRKGAKVFHPSFGVGKIASIEGKGDSARCKVMFPGLPLKKIVAKFLQPV